MIKNPYIIVSETDHNVFQEKINELLTTSYRMIGPMMVVKNKIGSAYYTREFIYEEEEKVWKPQ